MGAIITLMPAMFFKDLRLLLSRCINEIAMQSGIGVPPYFYKFIPVAVAIYFVFTVYIMIQKWMKYPMVTLPVVNLCLIWLSRMGSHVLTSEANIRRHRALYIFINVFNEVFNLPLISYKFISIVLISISGTICLIEGISPLSATLCVLSIAILVFTNIILMLAKLLYESSKEFIWTLKFGHQIKQRLIIQRTIASLRECRIYCGSRYFIDRGVLPKINNAIVENIINNVLMFNEFQSV